MADDILRITSQYTKCHSDTWLKQRRLDCSFNSFFRLERKHQSTAVLALGIRRLPMNYPHKGQWCGKHFYIMTSSWDKNKLGSWNQSLYPDPIPHFACMIYGQQLALIDHTKVRVEPDVLNPGQVLFTICTMSRSFKRDQNMFRFLREPGKPAPVFAF